MDPVTMLYYASVCAVLSLGAGGVPSRALRLLIGALVGVIAAAALPALRVSLGLY
ncbi:hypothetical protein [Pararhodobacter oceanensis]|uniref:hypothetical protein n=1 Tax=Pararhodobacter oceanensis TaxID=2172121 RepID=UPI003A9145D7